MEPIGTISMYYTFLSDNTIQIVEEIVERSESLHDIVSELVKESGNHPITSDISLFTLIQSLNFPDCWEKIRFRAEESILTKPFGYHWDSYESDIDRLGDFSQSLNDAIQTQPDDWFLFQLYLFGLYFLGEPKRSKFIELARNLAQQNPEIHRFLPLIYQIEMTEVRDQGNIEEVIRISDKALEIAREYDDLVQISRTLALKANTIKDLDPHTGLELLDEAYSIVANRVSTSEANYALALMIAFPYYALGEYDMALELAFEDAKATSEFSDKPLYNTTLTIANIYCELDMPKDALEWLRSWSDSLDFQEADYNTSIAHAFILLGQLEEAARFLELSHSLAMKSGREGTICRHLHVQGLYDLECGSFSAAIESIVQALNIADPQFQILVNLCLKSLTRVEIAMIQKSTEGNLDAETSGQWMTRLKKQAHEKNYPGIKMQHALLKAEYQEMIGETEAAQLTLQDALTFTDSPGVKTLRQRILKKLDELETSVKA